MAMAFNYRTIEAGARDLVLQVTGVDVATTTAATQTGSTQTGILAANVSGYTPTIHNKVRRVLYNTTNCIAQLQWHATANTQLLPISGYGDFNLDYARSGTQGIAPDNVAGITGDIDLLAIAIAAVTAGGTNPVTAALELVLFLTKGV